MANYSKYLITIMFILNVAFSTNALTVKLGSLAPSGSPWDKAIRKISAEWKTISKGKVIIKVYPGGVAGDELDMIRKMRINQLHSAALTGIGMTKLFAGVMSVQLPLLVRNDDELHYVMNKLSPRFEKEIETKGFKVLTWTKVGWVHFFSKEPVINTEDLQKQKLWIAEGDADGVEAWKNAGFNPVPLSTNDIMTSLQSGMIEGISVTPLSAAAYQWFGVADNMCDMQWAPLLGGIVINTSVWNKLPPALQEKLEKAAKRIGQEMQEEIDQADKQAISIMKQNGLKITHVPDKVVMQWKSVAEEAYKSVVGKSFDEETYKLILQYLKEYRNGKNL